MAEPTVGVAVPSIPPRKKMLDRALRSIVHQTRMPDRIAVAIDHHKRGAPATRNEAWRQLDTDYVAFLDDDDEMYGCHLERLLACAIEHDAAMVFPWFDVEGGHDPFAHTFGQPWDPAAPRQTTITCLWKRSALEGVGGFEIIPDHVEDEQGHRAGEDWWAVVALNDMGGRIVHLPERTWRWFHHGKNTSGLPTRWT